MAQGTKGGTRTSVGKSSLKKITVKYLQHRWTHLGKKSPLRISWTDGEKIVSKYFGHRWSHLGENRQASKKEQVK